MAICAAKIVHVYTVKFVDVNEILMEFEFPCRKWLQLRDVLGIYRHIAIIQHRRMLKCLISYFSTSFQFHKLDEIA